MPVLPVWQHEIVEGLDWEPMDLVQGRDKTNLVEADVTDLDVTVYSIADMTAILSQTGLDPGAVTNPNNRIFDTLQTDGRWSRDNTGYNSRHLILWSALTGLVEAGHVYRVEIKLNTSAWNDIYLLHEYTVHSLWSGV